MQFAVCLRVGRGGTTAPLREFNQKLNHTLNCELVPLAKVDRQSRNGGLEIARPTGFNRLDQGENGSAGASPSSDYGD